MSEMTLEQVRDELRKEAGNERLGYQGGGKWLDKLADAIDAHLTRASVQVTDADVSRACIAYNKKLGEQGEHVKPSNYATPYFMRAALEDFSARLSQPVVPNGDLMKVFCRIAQYGAEFAYRHPNWSIESLQDGCEECLDQWLKNAGYQNAQPHPQAAQGGEAVGEIDCLVACRRLKTLVENYEHGETGEAFGDKEWLVHDFIAGSDVWSVFESLYSQPAERAAVPEEVIELLRDLSVYRSSTYKAVLNAFGNRAKSLLDSLSAAPTLAGKGSYQQRVADWMQQAFIPSLYSNMTERGDRVLEEVLELLQSHGYDPARVATLVQYVFGRPAGEPAQEVGGVMVTLAGYCFIAGLDMHAAGEAELARICQPEVMAKIRAKQEAKNALHFDTPLPGQPAETEAR